MKFLSILFTVLLLSLPLKAYELLMFSVNWCSYCVAFNEQVAPEYNDTEYAETLPLTIIDAEHPPEWFTTAYQKGDIKKIKGTPTFIIWDKESQAEIDRFVGYNGKEWFYERVASWIEHSEEYYGQ
tara:strand:+ start:1720 stop:2097 length:378 start_codon:yes stop_codon:yes gene_type:complete